MSLAAVDFTDLDNFAAGFPHELFAVHRREAPVYWHGPTEHTPDGEGFWSVATYAETVAEYEPQVAEQWAETLPEGKQRQETYQTIYENWPASYAAGAAAFAGSHGIPHKLGRNNIDVTLIKEGKPSEDGVLPDMDVGDVPEDPTEEP